MSGQGRPATTRRNRAIATLSATAARSADNLEVAVVGHARAGSQSYTVKSGDTLGKIAKHFYGDEMKWHAIRRPTRP